MRRLRKTADIVQINEMMASRLCQLRLSRGVTQRDLADNLGITSQQVSKYESGTDSISVPMLIKICEYFRIESSYFFDKKDTEEDEEITEPNRIVLEIMSQIKKIQSVKMKKNVLKIVKMFAHT